jgi:transcriptional regulator
VYNPPRFQSHDRAEAFALMDRYPFATLITVGEGQPMISHLPMTPKIATNEIVGHLARANPHWRQFGRSPATAVFQGAHAFVTPKWYVDGDVPTWNYSAVHVTGPIELVEDADGIVECLRELTAHVERLWPSGWTFAVPPDLEGPKLSRHIVGFRLKVEAFDFKRKLSQNRTPADRAGVLEGLACRDDDNSRGVLADMEKLYQK